MDIKDIELAAKIVFQICRNHPEFCPHDYEWIFTENTGTENEEKHYRCNICGAEQVVYKWEDEIRRKVWAD